MRRSKLVKVAKRKKNALLKANGRTPSQVSRKLAKKNRNIATITKKNIRLKGYHREIVE